MIWANVNGPAKRRIFPSILPLLKSFLSEANTDTLSCVVFHLIIRPYITKVNILFCPFSLEIPPNS